MTIYADGELRVALDNYGNTIVYGLTDFDGTDHELRLTPDEVLKFVQILRLIKISKI